MTRQFTIGDSGKCRVRAEMPSHIERPRRNLDGVEYHWRCVEGPAPLGARGEPWILYHGIGCLLSANTTWFDAHFEVTAEWPTQVADPDALR